MSVSVSVSVSRSTCYGLSQSFWQKAGLFLLKLLLVCSCLDCSGSVPAPYRIPLVYEVISADSKQ